mgnify:FL=1
MGRFQLVILNNILMLTVHKKYYVQMGTQKEITCMDGGRKKLMIGLEGGGVYRYNRQIDLFLPIMRKVNIR